MAKAVADGFRVRIECEAGTFYLEHWEARKLAAEISAATDDLFNYGSSARKSDYEQALREHREWHRRMEAELKGDPEC